MKQSFLTSLANVFYFDYCGFYLSFISMIYLFLMSREASVNSRLNFASLCLSCLMAMVCFFTNNVVMFWVAYELAILPLLYLMLFSSPYSERYTASWYLVGYLGLTSLPMLLLILFFYFGSKTFMLGQMGESVFIYNLILVFIFLTKVPYPPFHAWLPIVHAEASTIVSMALSGYIMKLGLVGIFRFCWDKNFYSLYLYFSLCLLFSVSFFFSSLNECDYKRWLAFLSLAHIQVTGMGLAVCSISEIKVVFLYSLGHGLSALLLFYLFQVLSDKGGSRNWLLLSHFGAKSLMFTQLMLVSLLTASSFPVTLQFVMEVFLVNNLFANNFFLIPFSFYLFLGGLVPMVIVSFFMVNNKYSSSLKTLKSLSFNSLLILKILSFSGVFFF